MYARSWYYRNHATARVQLLCSAPSGTGRFALRPGTTQPVTRGPTRPIGELFCCHSTAIRAITIFDRTAASARVCTTAARDVPSRSYCSGKKIVDARRCSCISSGRRTFSASTTREKDTAPGKQDAGGEPAAPAEADVGENAPNEQGVATSKQDSAPAAALSAENTSGASNPSTRNKENAAGPPKASAENPLSTSKAVPATSVAPKRQKSTRIPAAPPKNKRPYPRPPTSLVSYLQSFNRKPIQANMFQSLGLVEFSSREIRERFDELDADDDGYLTEPEIRELVKRLQKTSKKTQEEDHRLTQRILDVFRVSTDSTENGQPRISRDQWTKTILRLAEKVDHRVYPIAFSCFMTGATLGILTPVIPFLAEKLALSKAQFGIYIASFAMTKIVANIPAAFLVERYGRKPFFVVPTGIVGVAFGSLAFATSFEQMCLSRMLVGGCVAALTSSASMSMMDLGTKLNMTRTIAPVGVAFNAGIAMGPALGGLLVSRIGMEPTFLAVGSTFMVLMVANQVLIVETAPKLLGGSMKDAMREAVSHWRTLWQDNARLKDLLVLSGAFWISSAGGHATVLPLVLIGPQFGLDVGQTGLVFAGMAGIQVLSGPPIAFLCDTVGKEKVLVGGTLAMGAAMALLPFLHHGLDSSAVAIFALWGLGSAAYGAAPNSLVSDMVSPVQRGQALSMLRTSNDLGYLLGASLTGYFAEQLSPESALISLSAILFGNTLLYHRAQVQKGGYRLPNVTFNEKMNKMKARLLRRFF
ncbi:unnamed protein product [Amoebophrya sp. A120]|nr:unnamed protein product [Amoebophrya sp. A120]|eukprot:GSA120T00001691001.1